MKYLYFAACCWYNFAGKKRDNGGKFWTKCEASHPHASM
ncbi:hypothetical protein T12_6968 [Trichinella patagoniensis]|uniref:Uncharacterized protein n=1 Tax=Trichinella patagoniensis TaxID=990121 RepID=A0A0V0YTF8_9BILA|nr:hypothetical protein T12_6968 [Trichinella patagoniensis]